MKTNYRPEIDGLRAIAVIAVIIYHAQITVKGYDLLPGGFIGVDIFFVISGYLITSIILIELVSTGSFSFKYFYERRIRRIIPALFVVMLASLPFAWMYLLPNSLIDFSKSVISFLSLGSNFYFYFTGQEYGAESSLLKPFLHTWSLSVEEQYYILFPVFVIFIFKYLKKYQITFLCILLIFSLLISDISSKKNTAATFYFLYTRAWEFLAGSILAYLEIINKNKNNSPKLKYIMPPLGLILISHSLIFFNDKINHPSLNTLPSILGVCFIIWFAKKDELVTKLLSSKLIVNIGLISYSLYLWHYPIFAFNRITNFTENNLFLKILLALIILIISIISYHFVEKPFRNKTFKFNSLIKILFIMVFVSITFNLISIYHDGFKKRQNFPPVLINTLETLEYRNTKQNEITCSNRSGKEGFCVFNELNDNIADIILLGDSLSDSLSNNLIKKISKTKFRLINMSYSGNLFLPGFSVYNNEKMKIVLDDSAHEYRKNFIENQSNKNTYIIIYGDYNYYFEKRLKFNENEEIITFKKPLSFLDKKNINLEYEKRINLLKKKLIETLNYLSEKNKIILLYPTPISPENVLKWIKKNTSSLSDEMFFLNDKLNYDKKIYTEYNQEIINLFDEINLKNLYKIKLVDKFCPKDKCILYDNNYAYIFDFVHPSYRGSEIINELILETINRIENN